MVVEPTYSRYRSQIWIGIDFGTVPDAHLYPFTRQEQKLKMRYQLLSGMFFENMPFGIL